MIKRFTATYLDIQNKNFVVSNISETQIGGVEHSIFCVINNLLQRGLPVKPSFRLANKLKIDKNDTVYSSNEETLNKTTAIMRLQMVILQLLMNGTLSIYDSKWSLAIKTVGAKDYEKLAIDDLFNYFEPIFILADVSFKRPTLNILSVDNFNDVGYEEHKIYIDVKNSSVENEEYDVIYVLSMFDQKGDYSSLRVSEPINYTFSENVSKKALALREILRV